MSNEVTFILEPDIGKVTAEVSGTSTKVLTDLRDDLGTFRNVNCGKPLERDISGPVLSADFNSEDSHSIWLYRIYHNSVVDGPGRRSVIQVAGCSIRCPGCYVPETHDRLNGTKVSTLYAVSEILKEKDLTDGVTILGGEPFDQPKAIAELVARLKFQGIDIVVYSGYTIDVLIKMKDPNVDYILSHIDLLIDGPFLRTLRLDASEYRGSLNQNIIEMYGSSR